MLEVADELIAEVDELLASWRRRYRDRPDLERRRLLLLALEREQIVTVAYREETLAARLAGLPVAVPVRDLIRQCLVWIWKDEELHTTFIRGRLLRAGGALPPVVVFGRQVFGALSGWVSALRQHRGPSSPSPGDLAARALVAGARLTGRISPALARELTYTSFRRYCQLNVALERTAELAYDRLVELGDDDDEQVAFGRIRDDERAHRRAFSVLADALDEHDQLRAGIPIGEVSGRLAAISPWFLPASMRRSSGSTPGGFLSSAPVVVGEGRGHDDLAVIVAAVLDKAGVGALIAEQGPKVAVRTSFMLGYDRRDRSNVVCPAVLEEVAHYLRRQGATDVAVIEAPTVYGRYYRHRSVVEVAAYLGYTAAAYRIVDAAGDQRRFDYERGLSQTTISATWQDADVRLVVAKLRTDPNEFGHLGLCSLEGMAGDACETVYWDRQLDFRTATMMLLDVAPPDAAVVEAWGPVADGPLGVMGCRRPVTLRRIYAGRDVLDVDRAVLTDMGLTDHRRVPIIVRALHWFGVEPGELDVAGAAGPLGPGFRHPWSRWRWRVLAGASYPVYEFLSKRGNLFLPAIDEEAFPPRRPVPLPVRLVQRTTQLALGLRPGQARPA